MYDGFQNFGFSIYEQRSQENFWTLARQLVRLAHHLRNTPSQSLGDLTEMPGVKKIKSYGLKTIVVRVVDPETGESFKLSTEQGKSA